jgi:hypothetical protein
MRRRFSLLALGPLSSIVVVAIVAGCFNVPTLPAGSTGGGSSGGTSAKTDAGNAFCASYTPSEWSVFFCSDFDPPEAALPGPWATETLTSGTLAENSAAFASPPNSLDENVIGLTGTDTVDVALRAPLAFPSTSSSAMKLTLSLNPVTIDTEAGAAIVLTALDFFDEAERQYSLQLSGVVVSGALTLQLGEVSVLGQADGGPPFIPHSLPSSLSVPRDTWTTIDIEVQWTSATEAKAIVDVNGTEQLNIPLTVTVTPASMQVDVGTTFVAPKRPAGELTAPWELRYDNVAFTAK